MLNQNCKTKDFLKAFIKTDMEIHYFEVENPGLVTQASLNSSTGPRWL